jgi:beta-mannanase
VRGYPRDAEVLDRYLRLTGHRPVILHIFRNWTDATATFDPAMADAITALGAVPMISWQPPAGDLSDVASGEHDDYARAWADAARDWGGRLLLRFAHEMNGAWIAWRAQPRTFRDAWLRLRRLFSEQGANNVEWVWSPHVRERRADDFRPCFPGPDAVEWLALDGYNWGRTQSLSRWRSFDAIFERSYRDIVELAPGTPLMIAEIGCAEQGGDKAAWIRDAFLNALPRRYPAVRAVAWFNANPRGHADWRVESSPISLDAWREVVASPTYAAGATGGIGLE